MVYLVFKTDNWHTYSSREIIGVATNTNMAIEICKEQALFNNAKISEDDMYNLENIQQTQGYGGEGELQFVEYETDVFFKDSQINETNGLGTSYTVQKSVPQSRLNEFEFKKFIKKEVLSLKKQDKS